MRNWRSGSEVPEYGRSMVSVQMCLWQSDWGIPGSRNGDRDLDL